MPQSASIAEALDFESTALPDGWRWANLGELAEFINGAAFKPTDWAAEGKPIIRIQNLTNPAAKINRTTRSVGEKYAVDHGDLLVSWSATLEVFIWKGEPAWLNQHIFKVIPRDEIVDTRYMFYLLRHEIEALKKGEHLHGSTMMHINRKPFLAHRFPFPPIETQRFIVARIDELFTEIDDGEVALTRARSELETYRKALLKAAVTGELTAEWRAANPTKETGIDLLNRILTDRRARWEADPLNKGKRYKEPAGPEMQGLPELPHSWSWATAEMLSDGGKGHIIIGPFGSDLKTSDYRAEGVPLVFVRHIRARSYDDLKPKFVSIEKAHLLRSHIVQSGDILVTKMGDPPGDADIYPSDQSDAVITADCIRWRPAVGIDRGFCLNWVNSMPGSAWILQMTKGVAQQKISLETFKRMPVPVPPLSEALVIMEQLAQTMESYEGQRNVVEIGAGKASAIRQSILATALRGELV